ncbi:hypothetical protein [Salinarimonas rosea]|uniref:hypothetical protein n=1 Tax=Salinarimonas rosea TaxID=552063 RepID=UPI0003F84712|nr:hypothetical protein [Salinarimonas rosea]
MKSSVSTAALLAAILVAPPAFAQDKTSGTDAAATTGAIGDYGQLDADASGDVGAAEFQPYIDQTYDAWDTNRDDLLGEEEFWAGLFGTWDQDRNAILTEEEYDRGYASWFADIDLDEDVGYATTLGGTEEGLTQEAFVEGASGTEIWPDWSIGEAEMSRESFSQRTFERMAGEDDTLSRSEFESFHAGG